MSGSNDDFPGTTLCPSLFPSANNPPLPVHENEFCYGVVTQEESTLEVVSSMTSSQSCNFETAKSTTITTVETSSNVVVASNDDHGNDNNNNNEDNSTISYKRNNSNDDDVFTSGINNATSYTHTQFHRQQQQQHHHQYHQFHNHHHQPLHCDKRHQQHHQQHHSYLTTNSQNAYTQSNTTTTTITTTTTTGDINSSSSSSNSNAHHHHQHQLPSHGSHNRSLSSSSSSSSLLGSISEEDMLSMMEKMGENELSQARPPCECDDCLLTGPEVTTTPAMPTKKPLKRQSSWRKIRSFILWSPFIQVFKKHRYPWIQLAGHQGNFQAGDAGSVLKKLDKREQKCFHKLMSDSLRDYVPEYRGNVDKNGDTFIQLQDLLCTFNYPCVMDIKMGVRTYLEEELHKARKSPALRKDMYQKMTEVDPNAPTEEEHEQKAVTKPRYMQWRDEMSSSAELGFRVEGIKQSDGKSSKDFKKTKERENIVEIIQSFVGNNEKVAEKYLERLQMIMRAQESSEFFNSHEVVGSSLLFVHDKEENVNVWMIDFGKTEPIPAGVSINHRSSWVEGNREDGYLFGLDNLVTIFDELYKSLSSTSV